MRSKIIKEHLNDPVFYDRMSALLKAILDDLRAGRIKYQEMLRQMESLSRQLHAGKADDTPAKAKLDSPGKRALYNSLKTVRNTSEAEALHDGDADPTLRLTLEIDRVIEAVRPADWRGNTTRENTIKRELLPLLDDDMTAVERMFPIITAHTEY